MQIRRIGVLTSGGDAAGMNAAIRAVVRSGIDKGLEVVGVVDGFRGLLDRQIRPLSARDVASIMQHGGTILGTARVAELRTPEGQQTALANAAAEGIDGLVVIGGNGSQSGANALCRAGLPVVGVASTIDNDLVGSDITIGVDTALNVVLEAIDRLKVTASSHRRAFLVEVMGRDSGYLALMAGLAGGAEAIVIPESPMSPNELASKIAAAYAAGKGHAIVVVAEGAYDAYDLAQRFEREQLGFSLRVTRLGHVQRGGSPGAFDRLLGTRLGAAAIDCFVRGDHGVLVGYVGGDIATTALADVAGRTKPPDLALQELAGVLAK